MPQRTQIEAFRDEIFYRRNAGETNNEILQFLNDQLISRGDNPISIRTLKRQLSEWGQIQNARHKLEGYYEDICEMYLDGQEIASILDFINIRLDAQNDSRIGQSTLYLYLQKWGLNTRNQGIAITEPLIERVKYLYFNYGFSDQSIIRDLQREGYDINPWALRQIRYKHGMKRRARTDEEKQESLDRAIAFLQQDLRQSSAILGFGKGLLYQYVRQQAQVTVSQRRLYDFYRSVFPEEVANRRDGNFKQRGQFIVPGPNFLWSLDGYEKLKKFGFQIYGCIDAYSRCIIWFFIGRSATTSMSTLKQYLQAVQRLQMRPFFTRSDHGIETPLWAAAQAALAKAGPKKLKYTDSDGTSHFYAQGDRLDSCHLYGPSTRNVRIESWWRQLRRGATDRWITFFNELAGYAIFKENVVADQIAMYAIYGPIICDELATFVSLWNGHTIRNQTNRPNVKAGIPVDLYHTTEAANWGVQLSEDDDSPDQRLLHDMLDPLDEVDNERLLPQATEDWCNQRLKEIGFTARLDLEEDATRPFVNEFIQLRNMVELHQKMGNSPVLELTKISTGGAKEYERLLQRNFIPDSSLSGDPLPTAFFTQLNEASQDNEGLE